MFLRRAHPSLFINYQGVTVATLGTGAASALADPGAGSPPILTTFYDWIPINVWGWIYLTVGLVLVVGLFKKQTARHGLGLILFLLLIRLGFQVQQVIIMGLEGVPARELLNTVAGLPILYGFVCSVLSMTVEPFINPASSPDVTLVSIVPEEKH